MSEIVRTQEPNLLGLKIASCLCELYVQDRVSLSWDLGIKLELVYSFPNRVYHRDGHVLSMLTNAMTPTQRLAILFHDLVYLQVDLELPIPFSNWLNDIRLGEDFNFTVNENWFNDLSQSDKLVLSVFGFSVGMTKSPHDGLNEFLSALIACRVLSAVIPLESLLAVVVGIEFTTPFRTATTWEQSPQLAIRQRLHTLQIDELNLTEGKITDIIQQGIEISWADLASFSDSSFDYFVADCFKLILEANPALRKDNFDTDAALEAIQRSMNFYLTLTSERIFPEAIRSGNDDLLEAHRASSRQNLSTIVSMYKDLISKKREVGSNYRLGQKLNSVITKYCTENAAEKWNNIFF